MNGSWRSPTGRQAGEEGAQREIADCDANRKRRADLKETRAKRALAEARLSQPGRHRMTRGEIATLVQAIGDLMQVIKDADPSDKAEIYGQLSLTLA